MPPRLSTKLFQTIAQDGARSYSPRLAAADSINLPLRPFSSSSQALHKSRNYKPRVYKDPWTIKREQAKRAAVQARRQASAESHATAAGDPVRGAPTQTPFVVSLDTAVEPGEHMLRSREPLSRSAAETDAGQKPEVTAAQADAGGPAPKGPVLASSVVEDSSTHPELLNHFLTQKTLQSALAASRDFSSPYISPDRNVADPIQEQRELARHKDLHAARTEAMARILAPENASAREKLLLNKRRIVDKFGRHNTDVIFSQGEDGVRPVKERIGADTGSSEVQIAILTAKIKAMADRFEGREGRFDWVNKRNLRLLLHKRQKLLKYFERKERGGPRWKHLLDTLGLTEATWKGEIELR